MERESRARNLERLRTEPLDVLLLGGGINGAGTARDLALRAHAASHPLRIGLLERGRFASGASGRNSHLIHGGLRYLKYLQLNLVHEALRERAVLLRIAPHLVRPLAFLLPFEHSTDRLRYAAGLSLYGLFARGSALGRHRMLPAPEALRIEPALGLAGLRGGAEFHDCTVDAVAMVLANLEDAATHGVAIANHCQALSWRRDHGGWIVEAEDHIGGRRFAIRARKLVDATGAWMRGAGLRLVRGSHLVYPRFLQGDHAVCWFDERGRILFFLPWGRERELTLVGTTEVDHDEGPDQVAMSHAEAAYLQGAVARVFPSAGVRPVGCFSALRPLVAARSGSASAASRRHHIGNTPQGVLQISGGKFTTYRLMSEQAADQVAAEIAPPLEGIHLTAVQPLPGSNPAASDWIAGAIDHQMAQRLEDLLFVAGCSGYERPWSRPDLEELALAMGARLGWDNRRMEDEITRIEQQICRPEPVP